MCIRDRVVTTAIGLDIQRKAAVIGTKGSIYLDDFQKAETMTVSLSDGEEYEIEIPFEINGFEYQIREASNCIREGRTHSGIYTPQMSLQTLSLIDEDVYKRQEYVSVTDTEAMEALLELCKLEGIIPAIESAHALAYTFKMAKNMKKDDIIVVLSLIHIFCTEHLHTEYI